MTVTAISGSPAVAEPGQVTEFPLSVQAGPGVITSGPDGNLWFSEPGTSEIGRLTPTGQLTGFPGSASTFALDGNNVPGGIMASPDGGIWFTAQGKIVRINTGGYVTALLQTPSQYLGGITAGPEQSIWYADKQRDSVGRLSALGQITEFPVAGEPLGIVLGPDGNLWFTIAGKSPTIESVGGAIGRITPSGRLTEFPLDDAVGQPWGIANGPDGNLWFTAHTLSLNYSSAGKVGRITPQGQIRVFPLPGDLNDPQEITAGPDRHLWFTAPEYGIRVLDPGGIGAITPSGKLTDFPNPNHWAASGITSGPDGNLWFTAAQPAYSGYPRSLIGRITSGLVDVSITSRRAVVSHRWARLDLECAGPSGVVCQGRLRLRAAKDGHQLASRAYAVSSGAPRKVALRLGQRALELLSHHARLKVKATITLNGGRGETRQIRIGP